MKKNLLVNSNAYKPFFASHLKAVALAGCLSVFATFSASAQWVVYEANELPTDFTASPFKTASVTVASFKATSDQPVVDPQFSIIADPQNTGNNLLYFRILGSNASTTGPTSQHQSYLFRQDFKTTPTPAATIVVRAKGVAEIERAFELDLDFGGFRETIHIINPAAAGENGKITLVELGKADATYKNRDLGFDPTGWHTYRFAKDGNSLKIYIDESTTPAFTTTVPAGGSNNYFRIGDGSSGQANGSYIDYVAWEPTKAYSPSDENGALPTNLLLSAKGDLEKGQSIAQI